MTTTVKNRLAVLQARMAKQRTKDGGARKDSQFAFDSSWSATEGVAAAPISKRGRPVGAAPTSKRPPPSHVSNPSVAKTATVRKRPPRSLQARSSVLDVRTAALKERLKRLQQRNNKSTTNVTATKRLPTTTTAQRAATTPNLMTMKSSSAAAKPATPNNTAQTMNLVRQRLAALKKKRANNKSLGPLEIKNMAASDALAAFKARLAGVGDRSTTSL